MAIVEHVGTARAAVASCELGARHGLSFRQWQRGKTRRSGHEKVLVLSNATSQETALLDAL